MSIYQETVHSLNGEPKRLSEYTGKVTLIVNVASECGFTPQYAGLQKLHESLSSRGFSVLGFPSNEFGGQEPGTPEQIRDFCDSRYHVTFPLFEKIHTKKSAQQSPVYKALGEAAGKLPGWNFGKYLVGRDGALRAFFEPDVTPSDPKLLSAIESALAEKA
ncbi:MAG TPA: glutathione peroxidase [Polyangiaceae bacterium]|jgi:glutathione peroxidase